MVLVVTDGACLGNPGPGGWGFIVAWPDRVVERAGCSSETTNNRMELTAVLEAFDEILNSAESVSEVQVVTDSQYVAKGAGGYLSGWIRNGWKTSTGSDVANRDLWERMKQLLQRLQAEKAIHKKVVWHVVRGHQGIPSNERVDELSTTAARVQSGTLPGMYDGSRSNYPVSLDIPKPATGPKTAPYYMSMVQGVIQRHATWAECEQAVRGKSGAKFKKVHSDFEEQALRKSWS